MLLLLIFLIPMFISMTKPATTQTVQPPPAVTGTPAPVKPNKRKRRSHTSQTQHKIAATSEVQKSTAIPSTSGEKAVNPEQSKTGTGNDQ
jgi:hypothetical protein